ncbi:MAG: putative porin [Bacteroidaceae bacterium]|nr:putative porin [Bacteroidaceae bacterium]
MGKEKNMPVYAQKPHTMFLGDLISEVSTSYFFKKAGVVLLFFFIASAIHAQDLDTEQNGFGVDNENMDMTSGTNRVQWGRDTTAVEKDIPIEYHQWYIDEVFGTKLYQEFNDTLPHLFQNFNAADGLTGEYHILGNLGSPRFEINWFDRGIVDDLFFIQQMSQAHTTPGNILFTNTKSPVTNLQYHKSGTRQDGQDRFHAYFASNINKRAGFGFKFDYLYGRGYYLSSSQSQFTGHLFGYYSGERYEMHAFGGYEHFKMAENGGIEDDRYITDPQSFPQSYGSRDIPTVMDDTWNRNDQHTYYLTQKYNLGIYRERVVPDSLKPQMPQAAELMMSIRPDSLRSVIQADSTRLSITLDSLRNAWQQAQPVPMDFVPVTSFLHTFKLERLAHTFYSNGGIESSYFSNAPYYSSSFSTIEDRSVGLRIRNMLGIQLREGFNKWAKAGITLYAAHEFKHFWIPSLESTDSTAAYDSYVENNVFVGGRIAKTQGRAIHFDAGAEFCVAGANAGDMDINGTADLNFRLGRDTVRFEVSSAFKLLGTAFFFSHFHGKGIWMDNDDLARETRTRVEGKLTIDRTMTSLRFGLENISKYTHFASVLTPNYASNGTTVTSYSHDITVNQQDGSIQVMSAALNQDLHLGIFHWDNAVTWQHSTKPDVLPLPALSIYTNPYIVFHIAKVLRVELGADMRYFTKYYAPDYSPVINTFAIQDVNQERIKIGNWPIINVYANFAIKRVRGYINYTHANAGNGFAFWAPHYPIDPTSLRFGISWNFYD